EISVNQNRHQRRLNLSSQQCLQAGFKFAEVPDVILICQCHKRVCLLPIIGQSPLHQRGETSGGAKVALAVLQNNNLVGVTLCIILQQRQRSICGAVVTADEQQIPMRLRQNGIDLLGQIFFAVVDRQQDQNTVHDNAPASRMPRRICCQYSLRLLVKNTSHKDFSTKR